MWEKPSCANAGVAGFFLPPTLDKKISVQNVAITIGKPPQEPTGKWLYRAT
jgi:hypothetical protein